MKGQLPFSDPRLNLVHLRIMAVAYPQVEFLISLFFSEDDVNFSYVSYISTSGITTLHTQDIFLEKIKNHANNLIDDHIIYIAHYIIYYIITHESIQPWSLRRYHGNHVTVSGQ